MTRLWIRADGSASVGLGHVMRTLALAEAARRLLCESIFVIADDPVAPDLPASRGFAVRTVPVAADVRWMHDVREGDIVVFDGYHFPTTQHDLARAQGARVAAIDDFGTGRFDVDVLLNQNPLAQPGYDVPARTVVLIGPIYALVREEFSTYRRRRVDGNRHLVITFGGSDIAGMGQRAVSVLDRCRPFTEVTVIAGPATAAEESITHGRPWLRLRRPRDIAAAFDSATAVISAAGSTTWELLSMGLPTGLIQVADNQQHIGRAVDAARAGIFIGRADEPLSGFEDAVQALADRRVQEALTDGALAMVDGQGANRVLAAVHGS